MNIWSNEFGILILSCLNLPISSIENHWLIFDAQRVQQKKKE